MADTTTHVLLVDDDTDLLYQLKLQLEAADYTVTTAENRPDAERLLKDKKPDIAVIDLMMQEMDDGFILAHHIRKEYDDVPVILVTAVTSETGLKFGAENSEEQSWLKTDAILAKPIRFEQLDSEIKKLLRQE